MTTKQTLGQFYTTNYEYILQNLSIPDDTMNIMEPFAGNGDLVGFIRKHKTDASVACYDIDPKHDYIIRRDTIQNPPIMPDILLSPIRHIWREINHKTRFYLINMMLATFTNVLSKNC